MNYHSITTNDMLNGEGLRVVLWVSGCSCNCKGCQNPETHPQYSGIFFDSKAREELFTELSKDYISGVTFSGGHPLEGYNYPTVYKLCETIKESFPNKTIWLYTGFIWESIQCMDIMKYIDVLCDGRYIEELRNVNLPWVGSSNQRVIDVQKSLKEGKCVPYILK